MLIKRHRKVRWIAGTSIAITLILSAGFFAVGVYLAPHNTLTPADAIVVISGGGTERIEKGAQLYNAGVAPLMILSGAAREGDYSNAQAMKKIAIEMYAIPEDTILTDDLATNTYENALGVKTIIEERDIHNIILVTSAYHQRRSYLTFKHTLEPSIEIQNAPADVSFWKPLHWWDNSVSRHLTIEEIGKIIWSVVTGHYA